MRQYPNQAPGGGCTTRSCACNVKPAQLYLLYIMSFCKADVAALSRESHNKSAVRGSGFWEIIKQLGNIKHPLKPLPDCGTLLVGISRTQP